MEIVAQPTREQFVNWYEVENLSMRAIGLRCGVSATVICKRFRRLGIQSKTILKDGRVLWTRGNGPRYDRVAQYPKSAAQEHPTMFDIMWAAGIYEGEGCCVTYPGSMYPDRRTLRMQVTQKDRWILDRLRAMFGGTVYVRKGYGAHTTDLFAWNLYGPRARGFLFTIYTRLSPRRREQVGRAIRES